MTIDPSTLYERRGEQGEPLHCNMSLRDYFAAAALTGRLANPHWCESEQEDAEFAYAVADDMLTERKKNQSVAE